MAYQTEYPFTLPKGYIDDSGAVHKEGTMRLATAADEILPLKDPRVQQNPAYLSIVLMTRVITKLGSVPAIDNKLIEKLPSADMAYLQNLYQQINAVEPIRVEVTCPSCGEKFKIEVPPWGNSEKLPSGPDL